VGDNRFEFGYVYVIKTSTWIIFILPNCDPATYFCGHQVILCNLYIITC